ncbi:O-methylsterigmatocystin oxidoreductase OS=Aspergillus parasiticus GN=ordA PE=3 SV=1 [Rhizoctonia solani AG-1 IB]|uniref:O-methylsterigmatocystin oxidoreductase n=1 Tax=Thanatephorus cucumeris (strain AG1-IB / isolate 7/3/14) TaxID=1108050 RepID=A0A0B7FMH4_THACB|nr:O-methylsterigmatocystin oxidoreductase OS=Aspergillus parasiticus GN=ordA PE=3 SV=1 [Rhizoctonia solani AG-1 IB]
MLLALYCYWRCIRRPKVRNPPSPRLLPFVGNLFSIPPGHEYVAFAKIGEQLQSDIIYLEILGHKHIILNSAEAAFEVLDKRAAFHSSRPPIPMVKDPSLMNWSENFALMEYSDVWRHYRRVMNNWLNVRAIAKFNELQERQVCSLLKRLLSPTEHMQPFEHVKNECYFAMGSLMFQLAYGYRPETPQDPFLRDMQQTVNNLVSAGMQTNFLVNVFPAMIYTPDWFPGAGWKAIGRQYGVEKDRAKSGLYEWLKSQVVNGTHQNSIVGSLLKDHHLLSGLSVAEKDKRLKEIGITLFGAGTDTTATFLINLVFAMVANPDVQAKAQQELDSVLGHAVLPTMSDKVRLPYIKNLIDEVLRLYPVLPLALPHECYQSDVYRGYNIQQGTTIIGNYWAIGRDPRHYENPEMFNPDRFLDPEVPRPPIFGWGRRKCPGFHFAEDTTFIMAASLLSTFSFLMKKDDSGQSITPQAEPERNSIVFELKPFDFEFKPRSEEHRQLVLGAGAEE